MDRPRPEKPIVQAVSSIEPVWSIDQQGAVYD